DHQRPGHSVNQHQGVQQPGTDVQFAEPELRPEPAGGRRDRKQPDDDHAGRDGRALEIPDLALRARQRFRGDVVARQPADPAAHEVREHQPVPAALQAAGIAQRRWRQAEGDDVGQRVELAAQGRGDLAPARDTAVEGIQHERQRDQRHAPEQVADLAVLQVAHRREHRAGAAEGVAQREPVRELEVAEHREVARARRTVAHAGIAWHQRREPVTGRAGGGRATLAAMAARKIIHVDMDAFYASVEQRDDPALRGRPVVVAWRGKRSVVCAASYEARRFGVRSAMPAMRAGRLCPHAVFVPPDFTRYKAVSRQVHGIFSRYTDAIEPLSLDEAYLDVSDNRAGLPSATATAEAIRAAIRAETGLTASAGVAPNKFVAKIASDFRKPDGLFVVRPRQVQAFLAPLPVGRLPGV